MDSKPQSYLLVDTPQALVRLAAHLTGSTRLYLDTEFDKRKDRTIFCLLQIHNGEEVFLVDVQRLHNLEPLAGPLSQAEWVLHAGEQDVALLCQYLELPQAPNLFDTQIAWALLGPEHQVSLAYLLFRVLGLRSSKEHQVDDFTRRPLQPSMLNYAAEDVLHLPDLVDALLMRLRESAKADADRQREVTLAEAYRTAQKTKGEGDAKAAALYASAFGRNPEFYAFYRSLDVYKQGFKSKSDVMVLDAGSSFFKYLKGSGRDGK